MFFFFSSRRRHTRYWRDWSSDVCSSDLRFRRGPAIGRPHGARLLIDRLLDRAEIFALVREIDRPGGEVGGHIARSEERRVGKECRSRWGRSRRKKRHWRSVKEATARRVR